MQQTKNGTPYLTAPDARLVAATHFIPTQVHPFVSSFGDEFDAADYENDFYVKHLLEDDERRIDDGAALCKFAGQMCYLSFGEKRTKNDEAKKYFDNIKSSGHGSVIEHAVYSFVVWGIDRACSHEIVRHRAGFGYSQLSQRYVNGKTLRFVERPEYQNNERLHFEFESWIDKAKEQYDLRADLLAKDMAEKLEKMPATERRKAVNQAARNCLPNETETAMVITGNARAWRHFLEMRASLHADQPIGQLAVIVYEQLLEASPILFDDYEIAFGDRKYLTNKTRKV